MIKRFLIAITLFVLVGLSFTNQASALGAGSGNTTTNGCTLNTAYLGQNNLYIRFSANSYCGSIEVFDSEGATHVAHSARNMFNSYSASSEENGVIFNPYWDSVTVDMVTFTIRAHDPQDWSSYSESNVTWGGGLNASCVLTSFGYSVSSPGVPNSVTYNSTNYTQGGFVCIPVFNGTQYPSPIASYIVGGVNSLVVWAVPPGGWVNGPGSFVSDYVSFNYPGGGNVGGSAPVVTLTANPVSGSAGSVNPTLTWTVANGATSCAASGGWSGNKSTGGGSESTGIIYIQGIKTFTLECVNAYGQGSDNATVDVGPGGAYKDLIADVPTTSGAVIVNVAKTFTSTITNQGNTSTVSGFTNLFQVSQSSDGSNPIDYPTTVMSGLAGGASANASKSITFTSLGAWYIRACADKSGASDANGVIAEIDENNNCSMSTPWTLVTVTTPNSPDLVASTPTPNGATVGVAQTFSSTITNAGALTTGGGFTNLFQISQSSTGASGVTDYAVPGMSTLASGGFATTSKSITFPSAGTWYIRACADKSNASDTNGVISEYLEGNNCSMSTPWTAVTVTDQPTPVVTITANPPSGVVNVVNPTLTWSATNNPISCTASEDWSGPKGVSGTNVSQGVSTMIKTYRYTLYCTNANGDGAPQTANVTVTGAGGIDLTAGVITPTTALVGVSTTFNTTIQNIGSTATGAGFTNLFQRATAADGTGSSDVGVTSIGSSLAGGGSVQISKANAFATAGTHYMRACADKDKNNGVGTINEGANEGNNCGPWTAITVVAPGPDLVAAVPTLLVQPQVGVYSGFNSITINQGNQSTVNSFQVKFEVDNNADHSVYVQNLAGYSAALAGNNATSSVNSGNYGFPTAGTYYARACADQNGFGTGVISETDEGNNCSTWMSFQVGPTGTITAPPCVIAENASTCNSSVTWSTTNPITTSVVKNSANTTTATANSGTQSMVVKYPSETFTLYNNSVSLVSDVAQSSCASGTSWNTSSGMCKKNGGPNNPGNECENGAANYPLCTCTTPSCTVCVNGAANPPVCTVDNNNVCLNGADNPTLCTLVNGACLNGATNPPTCAAKKPTFIEN
ncbi:MAG: hypothetical protein KBC06_00010 [Candidatus Pacebacteria bacterium]|nr:hypothetical protein [Candidatus Paceibacterota bacterium]